MRDSRLNLTRLGWAVALPVLLLTTIGLLAIHATDRTRAADEALLLGERMGPTALSWHERLVERYGPVTLKQAAFFVTGVGLMLLTLWPSYQRIGQFAFVIYGVLLVMLAWLVADRYVNLPFVDVRQHVRRWIVLGPMSVQPSEFMKVGLLLALARYLRYRSSYRRLTGLIAPFLLTLVPMVLILRQPDLGTMLMLLPMLFGMLFAAGAKFKHLALVILCGVATMPIFYFYVMSDYQRQRIDVLFKQGTTDERWQMNQGYQLRQSKVALGTGGIFGEGYQRGMFVEHSLLPEEHNDFIFAIIGHQWGLIGGLLIIFAYSIIILVGLEVATVTNDPFGRLVAIGVVVMVVAQALLNICMTIGLAPITGMTLPFISYGGSSLWANFLGLGLLVNVAQRRPMLMNKPPFEHYDE